MKFSDSLVITDCDFRDFKRPIVQYALSLMWKNLANFDPTQGLRVTYTLESIPAPPAPSEPEST